ncbi:Cys-loop ligand-gated ion channel subunit protein, partial [Danaus plexippus plexippus]
KWTDDSMAWNPLKFNGTSRLTFRQGQIWSPSLSIYNSDTIGFLDAKNSEPITMFESGETILHMQTTIQTWCLDYSDMLTKWPHDEYDCVIVIEPWENHEDITFKKLDPEDMKAFADIDDVIQNSWDITTEQYILNSTSWNSNSSESDRFVIEVVLKRRATAFNIVFYTPLLVLMTFILLSFWTEPLNLRRIWFYAGCSVVICSGLCYIDFLVPCHSIPSILVLYTVVLGGVLLALLIHAALMTSLTKRLCKTITIQNILTAQWFRTLFFLPPFKTSHIYETINNDYGESNEDVMETSGIRNIEAMQSDNKEDNESVELAEAVDKVLFLIYSMTFAVMLALHF